MTTPYPNSNPTPSPTPNRNPHPNPLPLHPHQASEGVLLGPHVGEEERRRIVLEQRATRDVLEVR